APVEWLPRERRYGEKLATPDITIADLIGEVDPIKVAEGRYLSDELTIHYGLLPRTNRGIFALNELPDLAERIQVGLLNIMEERDVQIRGYKVRLPLDLYVVASANPEDYTNRGRIITPLKDRFGSQVRTHYPRRLDDEIAIMEAERTAFPADGIEVASADWMKQVVAELTHLARKSNEISQRSGVSVRVSICNYETLLASALKRAIRLGEPAAAPRVSDLGALAASTAGKIELETLGDGGEDKVLGKLVQRAVLNVFNRAFGAPELEPVVAAFKDGLTVQVSDAMPSADYVKQLGQAPALRSAAAKLGAREPAGVAAAMEFVLEGLHLSRKLNKDVQPGQARYRG
ncbi:MAG TPA: sigma 54-interacting transcriptional regulator, partial [Methylomirabilota bacterium]|nr:sigma 54-interacting transcriptional regulator [Methylomirabilota bacterium]